MKKKIILTIILSFFLIGNVFALDFKGTGKQGDNFTIIQPCNNATYVTLDGILYPDKTYHSLNINMTLIGSGTFAYNFTNTTQLGRYDVSQISDGCEKTFAYYFEITSTGITSTESRTKATSNGIWILFLISVMMFVGYLFVNAKQPIKLTFLLISMMFLMQTIFILFTSMSNEVVGSNIENYFSFLATASSILFWFAFGLLAVMWFLTTLQTLLLNKKNRNKEKYG